MQTPEQYGFDGKRLNTLDRFLKERYLDSGKLQNAQLLISRHGEIVHFRSFGPAREGTEKAIDEGSIFRIASMTKPITSIGFMMLVEDGKVALDTPVHEVLPEFREVAVYTGGGGDTPFVTKPAATPMRMLDLLRHTSGLTYGFQNVTKVDAAYRANRVDVDKVDNWYGDRDLNLFVSALAKLPLEFSPGEAWNYSVSTDVLGAVIQRLTGLPLDRYLTEKIFTPLKMHDTGFFVPGNKMDRLTDCFTRPGWNEDRVLYDRAEESRWLHQPTLLSGGGGLVSTALDYHRFCLMCANGGELDGVRLLGRKTLELMTLNHLPGNSDLSSLSRAMFSETRNAGTGFGLGFAVIQDVAKSMLPGSKGEYYWGGIFSTFFLIDPVEKFHVVFMTQSGPSWLYPIRSELKTLIHAALL